MDRFIPDNIRPLRRVEYEKLVEHGAFVDERLELVEGLLVPMSPIGPSHGSSVQKLTHVLVVALDGRAGVRVQLPFAALDTSEPEPDVAVVPLGDSIRTVTCGMLSEARASRCRSSPTWSSRSAPSSRPERSAVH
jgi:hypothetical protein